MAKGKSSPNELTELRSDPSLERLVLAAILHKGEARAALDLLAAEDFIAGEHRELYRIMHDLAEAKTEIGLLSVYTEAEKLGDLEGENLLKFLANLKADLDGIQDFSEALRQLRRLSMARQTSALLERARLSLAEGEDQIDEIIDTTIERLSETMRLYEEFDEQGTTYRAAAEQSVTELTGEPVAKILTGVEELDEITGGFRPGELSIITAETGSGKTLLAQQTRRESCSRGYVSLFCSGEMYAKDLLRRELAAETGVPLGYMRRPEKLTERDFVRLVEAARHQCEKCRILDGELTIARIRRTARALKAKHNLHLLILDYDELIETPGKDENDQMRRLARTSKSIGMELGCAVLLISQLRKEYGPRLEADKKDTRPPSLSRLYGSGAKTKHASLVIFAERKWEEKLDGVETEATLWVLKNRDGRSGSIPATFNIQKLRFESLRQRSFPPERNYVDTDRDRD